MTSANRFFVPCAQKHGTVDLNCQKNIPTILKMILLNFLYRLSSELIVKEKLDNYYTFHAAAVIVIAGDKMSDRIHKCVCKFYGQTAVC